MAKHDPKYKRVLKAKRYIPLKKRKLSQDFDAVSVLESLDEEKDRKDYIRLKPKEIARIESLPQRFSDPLEPRPWLSWSDCHICVCVVPADNHDWLENLPFSKWTSALTSNPSGTPRQK